MKYVVCMTRDGDGFTKEFDSKEDAIKYADSEWQHLSEHDKRHHSEFYIIKSANPDEDADNHLDGDVVKDYQ